MSSIDERIVKMTFDNDQFEQGIKTSNESLTKFKESLNKDTTATSLENISNTLSKMSFSSVLSGIESMTSRFSVFGISAATVIQDVTRKIESMADTLVSAVTTDPLTAGWDEYELKMNSVQTIMASTGEDIATVNQYLDELNQYADDTIYSFSDMTESIGKFTNSGVSLEDAVTAIKGISNEAAVSGANANEASRAMYNFAQALSTGYVALIDWKSIENANMATKEFKEQLLETAAACGTVEKTSDGMYKVLTENNSGSTLDDAIDATNGFRDSLSYQWMTTEVLIETLKDYGDATTEIGAKASAAATEVKTFSMLIDTLKEAMGSGWTETWENIFGDLEVAKEGWTSVSEALGAYIDKSAETRNNKVFGAMATSWSQLQQKFIDAGVDADDFNSTMTELAINTGKVTQDMIDDVGGLENTLSKGWLTTDLLNDAIAALGGTSDSSVSDATSSLEDYKEIVEEIIKGTYGNGSDRVSALEELGYDAEQLQTILNAVWDGSSINWDNYTEEALVAAGATEEEAEALMDLKDSLNLTDEELSQFVDDLNSGKKGGTELLWESITNTIEGLGRILGSVGNAWTRVFGRSTSEDIYNIISAIEGFTEKLLINEDTADKLTKTFEGLFSIFSMLKTTVTTIGGRVFKSFSNALKGLNIDILGFTSKLGHGINKFRLWYENNDAANKAIDAMVPLLKKAGNGIKSLGAKATEVPEISAAIEVLKNAFANLDDEIQNGFPTIRKWFNNFIEWLKSLDSLTLEDIKQAFKDLFTTLKDGELAFEIPSLDKLKEKFPKVTAEIEKFFNKIKNFDTPTLDKISEKFTALFDALKNGKDLENFPTLDDLAKKFPDVANIISSAFQTISGVFDKLSSAVSDNGAVVESVTSATTVFDTLGQALQGFGTAVNAGINTIDFSAIASYAILIGSLVAVFKGLSIASQFGNAAKSIGSLFDELTTAMKKVNKTSDLASDAKSSSSGIEKFRSIVVSLAILAGVLVVLGQQDTGDLIKAGAAITIMAGVVVGIQALCGLLSKKGLSGSLSGTGLTMVALAIALKVVVSALKDLSELDYTTKDALVLAGMVAALTIACKLMSSSTSVWSSFGSFAATSKTSMAKTAVVLIAIGVALKLMVSALKDLTEFNYTMSDALLLAGMVAALTAACSILGKLGGGLSIGSALTLVAIPIALKLLVSAFEDLANMDLSKIVSIIPQLLIILGEMAIMMKVSTIGGGTSSGGATVLAMAASMILIVAAMKMLASIDDDALARAEIAMAGIVACLTVFVAVANATSKTAAEGSKIKSGATTLLACAVVIAVMAASMAVLAQIDDDKLATAMAAILSLAVAFSAMEAFSSFTGKGSASSIVAMAAVIVALALAVGLLANLTDASALKNATNCLTQLMGMFSIMMLLSKSLSSFDKGGMASMAVSLASLTLVVAALAGIVGLLSSFTDASSLATSANALTEVMAAFALMMVAMNSLPSDMASIPAKIVSMVAVIGVIGTLCAAFGALQTYAPGVLNFLNTGAMALGTTIGSFVNGFVQGLSGLFGTGVVALGEGVSEFITSLEPALTSLSNVDSSVVENASNLATALLKITAAEILDGIAGLLGNDMDSFSEGLVTFGEALASFAEKTEGISNDSLSGALEAANSLVDIYDNIDKIGGVVGLFTGNQSWTDFASGLADFGTALSDFSKNVSAEGGIDTTAVSAAVTAASSLSGIYEDLDNVGGVVGFFNGEKDWSSFSDDLPAFGTAIAGFLSALSEGGFDSSVINEDWSAAMQSVIGVLDAMPYASTLASKVSGGTDDAWESIQSGVESFCGIMQYVSSVTGITSGNIDTLTGAVDSFIALKDAIPRGTAKALANRFVPTATTWDEVEDGIETFADMLSTISGLTADIKKTNINKLVNAGNALISLKEAIPKGTAKKLYNRFHPTATSWDAVGKAISNFASMCETISVDKTINTANIDTLKTAASSVKSLKANMPSADGWDTLLGDDNDGSEWTTIQTGLENFGTALSSFSTLSADLDTESIGLVVAELQSLYSLSSNNWGDIGEDALTGVINGMTLAVSDVSGNMASIAATLIDALVTAVSSAVTEKQESFNSSLTGATTAMVTAGSNAVDSSEYKTKGEDLVDALRQGITARKETVATASSSVATAGSQAIYDQGYSKFYSSGAYLMTGLAQGISDNAYQSINAAVQVAGDTLEALNNALDEASPSKATRKSGRFFSKGLALGIKDLADEVATESSSVGDVALAALSASASNIDSILSSDSSFSPTITPVLDLSQVTSGASAIPALLGRSYGLQISTANVDRLSASMSQIQNGSGNEDVVSAIGKLTRLMSTDRQNVYNLGGVTYDDGSNVATAVQALVRAARMERRA